jgi:hypothetical protein
VEALEASVFSASLLLSVNIELSGRSVVRYLVDWFSIRNEESSSQSFPLLLLPRRKNHPTISIQQYTFGQTGSEGGGERQDR